MTRSHGRASVWKYLILAAVAILLILLILIFVSVIFTGDDSYVLFAPEVYQGDRLSLFDFIEIRSIMSGCRAVFEEDPATDTPGVHTVSIKITGNGGYSRTADCTYTVIPVFRDDITLEAGSTSVTADDIIVPGLPEDVRRRLQPRIEEPLPGSSVPGSAELTVSTGSLTLTLPVTVVDTTPPEAQPKTVIIDNDSPAPSPVDFVTGIADATEVTCAFADEYDFTVYGAFDVGIILTDKGGNVTTVTSTADCRVDHTPPTLEWTNELYAVVGGTVSYLSDVTAADNSGEKVSITVNTDGADLNSIGVYTVIYTASDAAGNTATFERTLNVVLRIPPDEALVMETAGEIYDTCILTDPDMTKWDIAYAIFRWTHDSIKYVADGVDKSSWLTAAYDGMTTLTGDCFTYMSVSRALFEAAGIPCVTVEHMAKNEKDTFRHWWLLVDIGDGFYHFDSTRRQLCHEFEAFMRTDAELQWYGDNYDKNYYRFDSGAYPTRSQNTYYEEILQQPTEIQH